jgi:alkylated DNA repair dioxygenase AlkB
MNTLFPIEPLFPPGFSYSEDFISVEEERELCLAISKLELHTFLFRGYEAKRKVASYGYDYHFDTRSISKGIPIPEQFNFLLERVAKFLNISSADFTEVLVTEYPVGSVINWHRDAPPFDFIAGISLNADCKFKLRPYDKSKQGRGSVITFPVKRRSLYIMKDESRNDWEHSIDKVKEIRYSITLRTLRKNL